MARCASWSNSMRRIILGSRTAGPAYFDMTGRPPSGGSHRGGPFRIGDRAAAHVWLSDFRVRFPDRRLVALEDPGAHGTEASRDLRAEWLFAGLADEIWQAEFPGEPVSFPDGQSLYHVSLWRVWKWLSKNKVVQESAIRPTPEAMEKARALLDKEHVPKRFVTLQPLFDATYEKQRNAPAAWWGEVARQMSLRMPVVLLGHPSCEQSMSPPHGAQAFWRHHLTTMESLAVLSLSSLHVGGQTGLTLWASLFKVPVIATYREWSWNLRKGTESRPIAFGAPVIYAPLAGAADDVAFRAWNAYNGSMTNSTPL